MDHRLPCDCLRVAVTCGGIAGRSVRRATRLYWRSHIVHDCIGSLRHRTRHRDTHCGSCLTRCRRGTRRPMFACPVDPCMWRRRCRTGARDQPVDRRRQRDLVCRTVAGWRAGRCAGLAQHLSGEHTNRCGRHLVDMAHDCRDTSARRRARSAWTGAGHADASRSDRCDHRGGTSRHECTTGDCRLRWCPALWRRLPVERGAHRGPDGATRLLPQPDIQYLRRWSVW